MVLEHLSPSRIKTFEQCQLKYYAIYEEKLDEGPPHPLTLMGKAVHRAAEHGVGLRMRDEVPNWPALVRRACAHYGVSKPNMELARELMDNALKWGYLRNVEHCIAVEQHFLEELPDGTKVKGIVDRLDVIPPTTFDVIDIKTQQKAFNDATLNLEWQSVVYNWAVRKKHNWTGDLSISYWTLRHYVQRCWMTARDAKLAENVLISVAQQIRDTTDPEPSPSPLCQWCPKQPDCPASRQGVKHRFKRKFK